MNDDENDNSHLTDLSLCPSSLSSSISSILSSSQFRATTYIIFADFCQEVSRVVLNHLSTQINFCYITGSVPRLNKPNFLLSIKLNSFRIGFLAPRSWLELDPNT